MQLINGRSLAEYIETAHKHVLPSRRIQPVKTTINILTMVLSALDYAHSQEIIHRDIKPKNILIETHTKRPIILDFGLAKISRGLDQESSMIQGTPIYMPQEQIRNTTLDGRADIYATGVLLFEMLVSNLPLPRCSSHLELMQMKLQKKDHLFQRKPSEMNKNLHPDMDRIVLKAISFDPEMRFATCREFLEALEAYKFRYLPKKSKEAENA